MSTQTKQPLVSVLPFTIEADHPRNCDLLIQCIPGCRLRSTINGSRPVIHPESGETRVPLDQARHLAAFPQTPGMRLAINPEQGTYTITDPLHENDLLLEKISRYLRESNNFSVAEKIKGVPPKSGTLDVHRMKSLCREVFHLVKAGEAKQIEGPVPTMEDIEELPGRFLLNPGSRVGNTQPVYEDEFPEWVNQLSRSGG